MNLLYSPSFLLATAARLTPFGEAPPTSDLARQDIEDLLNLGGRSNEWTIMLDSQVW
jgi:hypothetical protein